MRGFVLGETHALITTILHVMVGVIARCLRRCKERHC